VSVVFFYSVESQVPADQEGHCAVRVIIWLC